MLSMLIMDVSGSTRASETIFEELKQLETSIHSWLKDDAHFHVNYRMGDELFILSSKAHYTLFIAFYAKLLWNEKDFPLKCSFHTAEIDYPTGDPEEWSHASIKETRNALEDIKSSGIQDFASVEIPEEINIALMYATDIFNNMTRAQQDVVRLKISGERQKDIAHSLNKSHSTISAHFMKSRGNQLTIILEFLKDYYQVDTMEIAQRFKDSIKKSGDRI